MKATIVASKFHMVLLDSQRLGAARHLPNTLDILGHMDSLGFDCSFDRDGAIAELRTVSPRTGQIAFLSQLAPLVRPGSYVIWRTDSGAAYRQRFRKGMSIIYQIDDPTHSPGEEQ
jgi:hypothetical protein